MIKYENQCVGCPTEIGCISKACPYIDVPVYICDECGEDAKYQIDSQEYCKDCASQYVQESFNELTLTEKAKLLNINLRKID